MQFVRWENFAIGASQLIVKFVMPGIQNLAAGSNFISYIIQCVHLYVLKSLPHHDRVMTVVPNLDSNKHGYIKQYICFEVWNSGRCDAVLCGRNVPTFWTNLLSPSSAWKNSNVILTWRHKQGFPMKCLEIPTILHGFTVFLMGILLTYRVQICLEVKGRTHIRIRDPASEILMINVITDNPLGLSVSMEEWRCTVHQNYMRYTFQCWVILGHQNTHPHLDPR